MHRVLSTRPPRRLAGIVALVALLAVPVLAATSLTPKNVDQAKLQQAAKLFQDFKAKKLSPEDQAAYRQWRQKARQEQRAALSQRPAPNAQTGKLATPSPGSAVGGAAGSFASAGGTSESCECTATCQTVLVVNGGSIYFEGSGTVAGPSACADAAAEFCGNAVSSFLSHWNCK
jgi:hypothetical protein